MAITAKRYLRMGPIIPASEWFRKQDREKTSRRGQQRRRDRGGWRRLLVSQVSPPPSVISAPLLSSARSLFSFLLAQFPNQERQDDRLRARSAGKRQTEFGMAGPT